MADQNTFGIAGLLGWPVAHSRSPVIHNHWLAQYGIPGRYVLFPVPPEKLEAAVRGIATLGLRGCNVTTPHKQAIFPLLDRVDDIALLANATSLGMAGKPPLEISLDRLPENALVGDLIYIPPETPLLAAARKRGNITVNGLGLLINQARPAFNAWFGVMPEITPALRQAIAATF